MVLNRFFSIIVFALLTKLSVSELSLSENNDPVFQKSGPQLHALVQEFTHNKETFTDPTDYFDNRVSITLCKFLNCFSDEIVEGHCGGAIFFAYCVSKITDSLFDNCAASQGGALFVECTNITIIRTNFTRNQALDAGGAVVLYQCTNFKISGGFSMYNDAMYHGCFDVHESNGTIELHSFISNEAKVDCACVSVYESQVKINKCYFIENEAELYPAALQVEEGEGAMETSCFVQDCYFMRNYANGGDNQISVHLSGNVTGSFINCVFDVDLQESIIKMSVSRFTFEGNKVSSTIKNPYESLIENKQEIKEYSKVFDHTQSNYVAAIFIVIIPIYVGVVFFLLIKD